MKLMTLSFVAASALSFSFMGLNEKDLQQSEVPSVVLNALSTAHPGATNVEWEKQNDLYEAEFDIDKKEYTVQLNAAGNLLQTKHEIAETELPEAVKSTITAKYAGQKIDDAELVEKGGSTYYQVELEGKLKSKELVFNASGQEQTGQNYWD